MRSWTRKTPLPVVFKDQSRRLLRTSKEIVKRLSTASCEFARSGRQCPTRRRSAVLALHQPARQYTRKPVIVATGSSSMVNSRSRPVQRPPTAPTPLDSADATASNAETAVGKIVGSHRSAARPYFSFAHRTRVSRSEEPGHILHSSVLPLPRSAGLNAEACCHPDRFTIASPASVQPPIRHPVSAPIFGWPCPGAQIIDEDYHDKSAGT